ncbi:Glycine-rich domain-containing protein-like [Cupriavidus necator]|uniref:Glycine-rich domain-containing protein-like n=2 Tax=Cupriavidus necator (strain ATCC 17699 / DSM 428 / KCTC 22496 / NCIMB 10442 / H16 / Stanier 337) TaxID=381666 RepID=A0AAE5ZBQ4_CUPNH|nr:hypothetical protein [Cupriavidus necator]QCC00285.1 hypothetical protein E6A55_06300 [Cupriavidus necator H16]QQB76899.1 hypothetical protein I6H87_00760 [Cupriavidus necator]WKA42141.1 hypothetical protein QWP09_06300 [Cupriavidus necator]
MQDRTIEIMWQAIDALDFSRMKAKLLHQKHAHWSPESLEQAESGYRQFLKLAAKHPDTPVVPSEQVDAFWHAHILDTRRYASDCERIFGYVLHHDPYVGIDGPEDEARLLQMAAASDALSMREFGSPLTSAAYCARAAADEPAYCARIARTEAPAYCARMAKVEEAAYCARMAKAEEAAYCARIARTDEPAYCARMARAEEPAYCARIARAEEPAYCARIATAGAPAYCALASPQAAAC